MRVLSVTSSLAQSIAATEMTLLQPCTSLAKCLKVGAKWMQCPHHDEKNSTIQALLDPCTMDLKSEMLTRVSPGSRPE